MIIDRNITAQPAMDIPETSAETSEEREVEEGLGEQLSGDDTATRAYFYWQERGCPEGSPDEDWFRAEQELAS